MSRLTFASLCLAAAPAFGQDIGLGATTQPFWETDPAYQDSYGPALAPTESAGHNAPLNDGTELSRLTGSVRTRPQTVTVQGADVPDQGGSATLLADYVTLESDRTLTASGGVVVWYQGARLVADSVRYDGQTGDMTIGTADVVLTTTSSDGSSGELSYDETIRVSVQVLCGAGSIPTPNSAQQAGDCKIVRYFTEPLEP